MSREAARTMIGPRGGAATSSTSCRRTPSPPVPRTSPTASAKADQAHQVRLLAAELGPIGIRVNGVNPDGVVRGSGIFSGDWLEQRAEAYGVAPEELGEFYASRTLLGTEVLPEHVADAVVALVGGDLSRTTGLLVPVDGGLAAALPTLSQALTSSEEHPMTTDHERTIRAAEADDGSTPPRRGPRARPGRCSTADDRRRGRDRRGAPGSRSPRRRGRSAPAATRFGRFPGGGEPRTTEEKVDDVAALHALTGANRTVSLHVPWDDPDGSRCAPRARRRRSASGSTR